MRATNEINLGHAVRRVREFCEGTREELFLKEFEGAMTLIHNEGWINQSKPFTLSDSFSNIHERLEVIVTVDPMKDHERYRISLNILSKVHDVVTPIESNTVWFYSFKDERVHQEINLGNGVIVKSTFGFKIPGAFASMIRSRLCVSQDFNLNVNFRVDHSLFEQSQLVRAAGFGEHGGLVSITGKGKVALVEDYILAELGYLPLDKELTNVFI